LSQDLRISRIEFVSAVDINQSLQDSQSAGFREFREVRDLDIHASEISPSDHPPRGAV
jgi:hypothetical protein